MPEGDTIYKVAAFMRPRITGALLLRAELLRAPAPELARRRVLSVDVHGKHLLITLSPAGALGWCLRVHLGMWGSWHSYPPGAPWKKPAWLASVVLDFGAAHTYVCFRAEQAALFRPLVDRLPAPGEGSARLRQLGTQLIETPLPSKRAPQATRPPATAAREAKASTDAAALPRGRASRAARAGGHTEQSVPSLDDPRLQRIWLALDRTSRRAPMVDVLLNQRIAAGIGNVYKSELLFLARVHPMAMLGELSAWTVATLFLRAQALLEQNLGGWARTTTRDLRRYPMPAGLPRLWAYGRFRQPCLVCETPIVKALNGRHERVTYWCPRCQPEGSVGLPCASWVVGRRQPRRRPT